MDLYTLLKVVHVIGAMVLFGTGVGIAFFMLMSHRSGDVRVIAHVAGIVVIADTIFTANAAVLQPITGAWLAHLAGLPMKRGWIGLSLILYAGVGLCWLPVVWIQLRMRDLAREAMRTGAPLPLAYVRLFRIWVALGVPAFAAMLAILALMVVKPGF
ncbi:DUF2269 domain-containing protein [Beijerinckia sp. L45]|uniref:DUF2269 family protein n=1 Tax=Beijerinckia sp. L45 TaxID=1641855 RepID=UPI00131C5B4C|nr:DUF2269 domain-containing protein [Beijerinckia sp. L45]